MKDKENRVVIDEDGREKIIEGNNNNQVPYWIVNNRLSFITLDEVTNGLKSYIETETMICIDDFKSFREQGFNISYGNINVNISLGKDVNVEVNLPISAVRGNEKSEIDRFGVTAPVNLKLVYETAMNIAVDEMFTSFLEDSTNNLISVYSGVDREKLPPVSATITNTECDFVTWDENEVKERMKAVLNQGINYVKIKGTDYQDPGEGYLQSFIFDTGLTNSGVKADFEYNPEWDMLKFDVKPRTGSGIEPPDKVSATGIPFLPEICTFKYFYKYDIEYPAVLTVNDPNSAHINPFTNIYEGNGYSISIPIWTFICGNQERRCTGAPDYLSAVALNESFVEESGYVETLFCEQEQRISKNITINISSKGAIVEGANVNYYCGDENNNNCFIGKTDANGQLIAKFPLCYNGIIKISKNGFSSVVDSLTTNDGKEKTLNYNLDESKSLASSIKVIKTIDFIKAYLSKDINQIDSSASELTANEKVVASIKGEKTISRMYPEMNEQNIELNRGDYFIDYAIRAPMKILPSFYAGQIPISYNQAGGVYEGIWVTGSGSIPFSLTTNELEGKKHIEFIIIATKREGEYSAVDEFRDSIFNDNGDIDAELLYENGKLISVDGMHSKDFTAKDNQKVEYLKISKEEYSKYVKPRLS
jgi:hypothetical protein